MSVIMPSGKEYYRGAVLELRERNGYHDSDFYAIVWDEGEGKIKDVEYDTTRFAGGGSAHVDATPEVKVKADAYMEECAYQRIKAQDERDAHTPTEGKVVKVVRGRKVPIGTVGKIFYTQEQTYSPRYRSGYKRGPDAVKIGLALTDETECALESTEVGEYTYFKTPFKSSEFLTAIKAQGGKWNRDTYTWKVLTSKAADLHTLGDKVFKKHKDTAWTYTRNVEVVNPEQYLTSEEELRQCAKRARTSYARHVAVPGYIVL